MKLVFFGATELGYECCKRIIEKKLAEVTTIFTIPREFKISYSESKVHNVLFTDFHQLGQEFNIPVIEVTSKMGTYYDKIRETNPDFLLVIGWYYMIPKKIREIASLGCAGMHASLLPKYRGGAPLVWSIINGETETGLTFFYLEDGIDNGDIIAQNKFLISPEDNIKHLIDKATEAALDIVEKYIPMISDGSAPRVSQDESQATYFPQREPKDGEIDWGMSSTEIRNFIRAQTRPYPGAFTIINGKKIKIWDADIEDL